MFTFKKFALVGITAALTAFSISCSDDDKKGGDPEDNQKLIIPEGYANSKVVTLGGASSSKGSFLDADDTISVYTLTAVGAQKGEIDLIYDGTNLFTVSGYDADASLTLGKDKLQGAEDVALLWEYTGSIATDEKPETVVSFLYAKAVVASDYGLASVQPKEGKTYVVFTTAGDAAIVKINSVGTDLVASVGNFPFEVN